MNVKTEARNEISTQETIESNDNDQAPSAQHGGYWILTVVLVAVAGLITALVIESSNSSSSSNDVNTPAVTTMDPQFDQDTHRAPPAAAADVVAGNQAHREADLFPAAPAVAPENQAHREADLFPAAAAVAPENQAHREADLFPSTPVVDPRLDSDFHRDPNGNG